MPGIDQMLVFLQMSPEILGISLIYGNYLEIGISSEYIAVRFDILPDTPENPSFIVLLMCGRSDLVSRTTCRGSLFLSAHI